MTISALHVHCGRSAIQVSKESASSLITINNERNRRHASQVEQARLTFVSEYASSFQPRSGRRGRRFKSGHPDIGKALTSGNVGQGLTLIYGILNRPRNPPVTSGGNHVR